MGYILTKEAFDRALKTLAGRFTDTDVIRYDYVTELSQIELSKKSDYAFKEILTPLSETLFFFTENEVKTADRDQREVIVFMKSCDMHAVRRLDQIYLNNGIEQDPFYKEIRDRVKFVLIGCQKSGADCFCVDMGTNKTTDGYLFSVDVIGDDIYCDVKCGECAKIFAECGGREAAVEPKYVTENATRVTIPEQIPNSIYKNPVWDEYSSRCIGCGRCNFVCPTCTCYTMQDVYYTENGKVGERRRVGASCMVDGYTNVAGGGQYRKTKGERMRFKVLHKIFDFRKRFGYDMCVGCGRCDMVIPKYGEAPISVSGIGPNFVDLTIRKVGRVTNEVFEKYKGQSLLLRGPYGNGFDTSLYENGEVIVIAGGTGVSPVRGVIDALAETKEPKDKHVIVGFRSPDDMLFRDDLKRWDEKLDLILTVDGAPEGYTGNIGLVTKYIPDVPIRDLETAQAVVVGPPPMMRFSVMGLLQKGFKEENIWVSQERKMCCGLGKWERKMCCGLGKCGHCRVGEKYICLDGPVFNYTVSKDMID